MDRHCCIVLASRLCASTAVGNVEPTRQPAGVMFIKLAIKPTTHGKTTGKSCPATKGLKFCRWNYWSDRVHTMMGLYFLHPTFWNLRTIYFWDIFPWAEDQGARNTCSTATKLLALLTSSSGVKKIEHMLGFGSLMEFVPCMDGWNGFITLRQ